MKKTTNTREKEINPLWLLGGNPNAIEQQEARGQEELVASQQLPRKCNHPHGTNAAEQYAKMGIKVLTTSKGDDLFLGVKLPDGWKKQATEHSMWNKLIDNKGRERASFFYKAAFYDRSSFINFETRYYTTIKYLEEKNPKQDWDTARISEVRDRNDNSVLFSTDKYFYEDAEKVSYHATDWLKNKFPDWQDINAYWD